MMYWWHLHDCCGCSCAPALPHAHREPCAGRRLVQCLRGRRGGVTSGTCCTRHRAGHRRGSRAPRRASARHNGTQYQCLPMVHARGEPAVVADGEHGTKVGGVDLAACCSASLKHVAQAVHVAMQCHTAPARRSALRTL